MTSRIRFSIVIPTLNEQATISRCLHALQDLRESAEIIVTDGGSIDDTLALAEPLADLVLIGSAGRARQMNHGANHAQGDILIFLHADTFLPDRALERIEQSFKDGACWGRFDIRLTGEHWMLAVIANLMNFRSRLTGIATGDQAIFVDRKTFETADRYPDIALMEDIALSKALKKFGKPACLKAKAISSGRRWEKFGVFNTIAMMWTLRLRYFFGEDTESLAYLYKNGKSWKQ